MMLITGLGLAAGMLTSWSLLPQVLKVWKMKETRDLSAVSYEILTIGLALWLAYGILTSDLPLIIANAISLGLSSTMLYFKFRYG